MKNSNTRRFVLALACAIALHAIVAWLITPASPHDATTEIVSHVTVARIVARPSPRPKPSPTARPVNRVRILAAPQATVVPRTITGETARASAVHRIAAPRPKPPVVRPQRPVWDVPVGGAGAGAGNRSGAGSIGRGAAGSGAGSAGNGNGGAAGGNEPCGYVEFSDPDGSRYDVQTHGFFVDISMSVHFPDGRVAMMQLDYPWYYPNEAANPWSDQNLHDPNFATTFQFPPAGRRAEEPALVQYVMAHTSADGYTRLRDCPASR